MPIGTLPEPGDLTPSQLDDLKRKVLPSSAKAGNKVKAVKGTGFDPFVAFVAASRLPKPVTEHRFHPGRRWRFDYAWLPELVALEVEGGAWTKGRHTRGQGFIDDMEKYNQAVCLGWRLVRFTPEQLASGECLPVLRQLLGMEA